MTLGWFDYIRAMVGGLRFWRRSSPLDQWQDCQLFVEEQAAHIAQTTLFGYLRTRAGLNHFALFNDPAFLELFRPARGQIYLFCVADLLIYMASRLAPHVSDSAINATLLNAYDAASAHVMQDGIALDRLSEIRERFMDRCQQAQWRLADEDRNQVAESPRALIDLAPVIDSLKEFDEEIVMNSMRFKWRSIRAQFVARAQIDQIVAELRAR